MNKGKDKDMKKKIAVLGLAVGLVLSAMACGTKNVEVGEYKGLDVEYTCTQTEVKEGHIYIQYWNELSKYAEEVKDKKYKAEKGDKVNIDYKGLKDGEAFDNGSDSGYELILGSGTFIEGFEDGLIGSKVGEKKNLNLTFPNPYKNNPDLAGKDVVFETKVNKIYTLPELTDEFVKKNLEGYNSVEEYKAGVKKKLEEELSEYIQAQKEDAAWKMVMADAKVNSYPDKELKKIIEDVKEYREYNYQYYYGVTVEQYLKQTGETQEDYDKSVEDEAKDVLANRMVMESIAKKENIAVSEDVFNAKVDEYMELSGSKTKEELFEKAPEEEIRNELLAEQVKAFVVDNCNMKLVEN
ncbi:MAG: trigger factor [Lachnospiraceae bacterium]|nr:trigger factor [Lachnospiraceae bacterium]